MELREKVNNMKKQIDKVRQEEKSLAYELLEDSKKQNKRSFILIMILIIILFLSNMGWLFYINQFDFTTEYTDVDNGNGVTTYLENSQSGDISYGENN